MAPDHSYFPAERHTLPFGRCLPSRTGSKRGQGLQSSRFPRGKGARSRSSLDAVKERCYSRVGGHVGTNNEAEMPGLSSYRSPPFLFTLLRLKRYIATERKDGLATVLFVMSDRASR